MKRRKLFGLILSVFMAVSIFSVCIPTASAAGTVVWVDASCDMPVAGERFDPTAENWSARVPADAHYSVASCKWYPSDGSVEGAFTFREGKSYFAVFTVVPDRGYLFSDYLTVSSGERIAQVLGRSGTKVSFMISDYTVPVPAAKVGLSVEIPRLGTNYEPSSDAWGVSVDGEYKEVCVVGKALWYPEEGTPGEAFVFEPGTRYCLEVELVPADPYVLSASTAVTIDGETVKPAAGGNGSLTVRKVFTVPAEKGEYEATIGKAVVWTKGDDWGPLIVFERTEEESLTYDRFVGVEIDGEKVAPDYYLTTRGDYGTLELTIRPEFLETLSRGKQTLTALFMDGEGEALIAVKGSNVSPEENEESEETPERSESGEDTPGEAPEGGESGEDAPGEASESGENGETPEEQDTPDGSDDRPEPEKPDEPDPADGEGSSVPEDESAPGGGGSIPPWTGVVSVVLIAAAAAVIVFAVLQKRKK